jgi:hypothetical protein
MGSTILHPRTVRRVLEKILEKFSADFFLRNLKGIFYYNNKPFKFKKMKKVSAKTRRTKTTYVPVSNNVYFDGSSYRVRVSVNGQKTSRNFSSKRTAITFRNQLLATA